MISVESVVAENLPAFFQQSPGLKNTVVSFLRYLFHESEFKRFEQNYPHLSGFDFIDQVMEYFDFSYSVNSREKERIPVSGRVVIIANHPIGSLDGLALLKLIGEVRSDVRVVANELLLSVKPLTKLLLPVDNMNGSTVRQNLKSIQHHLESEGAIIIFPAGEVSRMTSRGIRDGKWNNGFLRMASKTASPILPVFIDARNSVFFYSLSALAKPVSTLWLVREMFKQARRDIKFKVGNQISVEHYQNLPFDIKTSVKLFKKHVYKLGKNKQLKWFKHSLQGIAHPESRQQLRDEIRCCELLGCTGDNKKIYLYKYQSDSSVMRELARLRELSFRAVGEGSGKRRDMDKYDSYYDHIVLWDDDNIELVGSYRLIRTAELIKRSGIEALYTNTLFSYQSCSSHYLDRAVELGRSFVQPKYWGKRSLDYLWYGIAAYLKRYPEVRYLLGPVSISNSYPDSAKRLLITFYQRHYAATSPWAIARSPYLTGTPYKVPGTGSPVDLNYKEEFSQLKRKMSDMKLAVPALYKQYTELCEPGGVEFVDFNIDKDFADCVDGLVVVDLENIKASRKQRYFGVCK